MFRSLFKAELQPLEGKATIHNTLSGLGNAKPMSQKAVQKLQLKTVYIMKIWLLFYFVLFVLLAVVLF